MSATLIPFALTSVFATIFVYSAAHEFMRRRREGPLNDPRQAFEFDESAPSYQAPEELEATNAEAKISSRQVAAAEEETKQHADSAPKNDGVEPFETQSEKQQ